MAHATEILIARAGIIDRIVARLASWKERRELRADYKATVRELSALSDSELWDLGLSRGSIRHVAKMATYGK